MRSGTDSNLPQVRAELQRGNIAACGNGPEGEVILHDPPV